MDALVEFAGWMIGFFAPVIFLLRFGLNDAAVLYMFIYFIVGCVIVISRSNAEDARISAEEMKNENDDEDMGKRGNY